MLLLLHNLIPKFSTNQSFYGIDYILLLLCIILYYVMCLFVWLTFSTNSAELWQIK